MSLEFEKLAPAVEDMVRQTRLRRGEKETQLDDARFLLNEHATAWEGIEKSLQTVFKKVNRQYYRAARPLHHNHPLNQGTAAPPPPEKATILACDGSQIVPDRHAPFPYYLINVGLFAFYHGSGIAPEEFSDPKLKYPKDEEREEEDPFTTNSALVGLYRDRLEMESLANTLKITKSLDGPKLAILDQRLLYWPASGLPQREGDVAIQSWLTSIDMIREDGSWLAGFIDRPSKSSVLSLLQTLDIVQSPFDPSELYDTRYKQLTDIDLFESVLEVGERSAVFVEISDLNTRFYNHAAENEVCFFYIRTGKNEGQLARVDIPMWVANNEETVAAIHALIFDQCQILGEYPYVITRADEIAVVGRRDQEELEHRIALRLAEQGIHTQMTSKQQSKGFARSSKTRHERI